MYNSVENLRKNNKQYTHTHTQLNPSRRNRYSTELLIAHHAIAHQMLTTTRLLSIFIACCRNLRSRIPSLRQQNQRESADHWERTCQTAPACFDLNLNFSRRPTDDSLSHSHHSSCLPADPTRHDRIYCCRHDCRCCMSPPRIPQQPIILWVDPQHGECHPERLPPSSTEGASWRTKLVPKKRRLN